MRAMLLSELGPVSRERDPLQPAEVPKPEPQHGEIRLQVLTCGVCHTELDEIEGRTPPPRLPVIPGHQVIGIVEKNGPGARRFIPGSRLGVGWIYSSTGSVEENLSSAFRATGRDVNGGYAEYMIVPETYAYEIPQRFTDECAAPLLCAGAVGYRALKLCGLTDGEALGLIGFGGSNHLVLQLSKHLYPNSPVLVFTRGEKARALALELGADWAGRSGEQPAKLDAAIDTTPVWTPVLHALAELRPGAKLVINAIRKEDSDKDVLLHLDYERHLWLEKEIKTVANVTRFDLEEFLPLADLAGLNAEVEVYPLEDAGRALQELNEGNAGGAKVLRITSRE